MTLTLDKGHLNWYLLKGLAKDNHSAYFYVCRDENVRENAMLQTFKDIPSAPDTLTLEEDRLKWYALKGHATDYHYTTLHDCIHDSV